MSTGGASRATFAVGETPVTRACSRRNPNRLAVRYLGGTCGLLGVSCGHPELPRGDADYALEVAGELALVTEPGVRGRLRQRQAAAFAQEVLGALDAAGEDVLVRRQPGGPLELPGEVADA